MDIIISNASGAPIYEQILQQVKGLILRGELPEGEALPSMRLLAKELRISVITTKNPHRCRRRAIPLARSPAPLIRTFIVFPPVSVRTLRPHPAEYRVRGEGCPPDIRGIPSRPSDCLAG